MEDAKVLILSRRAAERIYLGDDIVLTIVAVGADKVRIGVTAPSGVRILRNELDLTNVAASTLPQTSPKEESGSTTLLFSASECPESAISPEASERKGGSNLDVQSVPIRDLRSFMNRRRAA